MYTVNSPQKKAKGHCTMAKICICLIADWAKKTRNIKLYIINRLGDARYP